MTTPDDWGWEEQDFPDLLAAIYEATCADCSCEHPTQLCCAMFFCAPHFIAHATQFHGAAA